MSSVETYRCADYDMDTFFDRTTSWPDGLHEMHRFEPNLPRAVRRTSSADDIQRYRDHFCIAQRNLGGWLTWTHYLKVLRDDLRHFDTLVLMSKAMLKQLASPRDSEISHYVTASESDFSQGPVSGYETARSRLLFAKERRNIGDADSVSSMADITINSISSIASTTVSFTPQKNLLKKFCSEIRQLASKTIRTVEKMSAKPKYCSACGDHIDGKKIRKECPHSPLNVLDDKKSIMSSNRKNNSLRRMFSISGTSVTSIGSGVSPLNPQATEEVIEYSKKKVFRRKMSPFIKENYKEMKY